MSAEDDRKTNHLCTYEGLKRTERPIIYVGVRAEEDKKTNHVGRRVLGGQKKTTIYVGMRT